ncbi:hypothetical protein J1N35_001990, partial [Gossypium stocksii]
MRENYNGHGNRCGLGSDHSQHCEVDVSIEAKTYACITKYKEMSRHLAIRGIQLPNFAYDFLFVEGS